MCNDKLIYEKNKKREKNYEVAHIYPLNPKEDEKKNLVNVELLNPDVNHLDNLIPLCPTCHTKFDKPRTRDEYNKLLKIKKEFIRRYNQHDVWSHFNIEEDLKNIIDGIYDLGPINDPSALNYDPKTIEQKLNDTITAPTKNKIKFNVTIYYVYIKRRMAELDAEKENAANIISFQVQAYFKKQQQTTKDQQEIFQDMVAWIEHHFKPKTIESAEIITSFFIQNCEIF